MDDFEDFPPDAYLRAARLHADFSQRELAKAAGLPPSVVARLESEPARARIQPFARALHACGLRLTVVKGDFDAVANGDFYEFYSELIPAGGEPRDRSGRRFPAHLDVRSAEFGWWAEGWPMFQGRRPEYTFDRARWRRNARRERIATDYFEQRCAPGVDPDGHLDYAEAERETDAERETEARPEPPTDPDSGDG